MVRWLYKSGGWLLFFKRKGRLKKEYDEKLLNQLRELKADWNHKKYIFEKSYNEFEDLEREAKLAELKFFYVFKEAKQRNIKIN